MKLRLDENWTTNNNGYPLFDENVEKYLGVLPTPAQAEKADKPFYCFIHYGMNTATGREWGNAAEKVDDFDVKKFKPKQWIKAIKASGATGVILTAKHHDGFCMWATGTTDFNVMNSALNQDVVWAVKEACENENMDFGIYLSPWDMHEKTYATEQYNDFFCRQLTELLTKYGDIFEVWFDGAKGADAKAFHYDWERYYKLVKTLQPNTNIAICGPDIRWVGNEQGKARRSEYCVVPEYLTVAETVEKNSQSAEDKSVGAMPKSSDEDLGSRELLSKHEYLKWYPAEVDVSIRKGWFYPGHGQVKSVKKLFNIYLNSVGNNSFLLLNVPPSKRGVIVRKDKLRLKKLGERINSIYANPVLSQNFGELKKETDGYVEFNFDSEKALKYAILREDITKGQRIEKFDLYLMKNTEKYKRAYSGTVVGMRKIIPVKGKYVAALLVVRQSRGTPCFKEIGFYE